MKQVFSCEDYELLGSVLTIYSANLIGLVRDDADFKKLLSIVNYDSIVCPDLFKDEYNNIATLVIFK
jgi:hypothetical protein